MAIKEISKWILTVVAFVLFVRLAMKLFNMLFSFSETPIGRLVQNGTFLERFSDINPFKLVVQTAITIVIVAVIISVNKKKKKAINHENNDN